ncbi:MAG: flagellar hook assembly protein FlgD [Bradyrhizobium sp.]|nr:flagellar hook capping FlgD N-terminal domain-containing protein [Bradyrhizobium sp.]
MAVDATMPNTVVSGTTTNNSTSKPNSSSNDTTTIASNFQTFLTLLTTQLQNQNPLSPLDTNQFTAQLVQFAGVEQQLKQNEQLTSLINLEKTAQSTQALAYVGNNVAVDGSTQDFNGSATWNLNSPAAATATITISTAAGSTAYTGAFSLTKGKASFVWDGKGNDGTQYPAGTYKMTATYKDSAGKDVAIPTEIQGVVDSVDLTAQPPLLSIGGKTYTTDQIKRVIRQETAPGHGGSGSS